MISNTQIGKIMSYSTVYHRKRISNHSDLLALKIFRTPPRGMMKRESFSFKVLKLCLVLPKLEKLFCFLELL